MNRITWLLCGLLVAGFVRAQAADEQIRKELQTVLDLGAAPKEVAEDERKARVEQFKAALVHFADAWEPRAAELSAGRYELGRALALLGRPEAAIPHLESFLRAHATSTNAEDAALLLGGAFLESRQFDRAAAVYQEFLASRTASPKRIVARYYLAIVRLESGHADAAIAELRSIVRDGGEHPIVADARLTLAQTLAETGRVAEAREALGAMLAEHPDAPALVALREQLDWIGKPAPEIDGVRTWLNGEATTFAALRGSVVVVTLFAEPYESSQIELVRLRDLATEFASKPVRFLGLTTYYRKKTRPQDDEDKLIADYLGRNAVRFPVALVEDFRMLRAFGVRGVPYTVVIGSDGLIDYVRVGASKSDARGAALLRAAIERATSKRPASGPDRR